MIVLDVLYVALATIVVMVVLQLSTFLITRMMYPPEARIVYRDAPLHPQQSIAPIVPTMPPPSLPRMAPSPTFTQPAQEIQLPEYEPRKPVTDGLRLDAGLPDGIQETRPPGT